MTDRSYIRVFGYTFFSDWTENGATGGYSWAIGPSPFSPNYNLITHTSGGQLQYSNQLNDQNLLTFTGNYTTANVLRLNNEYYKVTLPTTRRSSDAPGGAGVQRTASDLTRSGQLPVPGRNADRLHAYRRSEQVHVLQPGNRRSDAVHSAAARGRATPGSARPAMQRAALRNWVTIRDGNNNGPLNEVKPGFANLALSDEFRPSDQFLIDAAIRYDNYNYSLAPSNESRRSSLRPSKSQTIPASIRPTTIRCS